jgi:hypothetical protein
MKISLVYLEGTTRRPSGETTNKSQSRQREGEMKPFVLITVLICFGCSISGCGSYGMPSNSQSSTILAGNWQFKFVSSTSGSTTVSTGTLTQTGSSFAGTETITGSCATSGMINGTISGLSLSGTLTESSLETITFSGTEAISYNSASGTYQVTSATGSCAAASGDMGTWTATRASASGTYGGMVRSADRIPVQIALNLTSDGSQVSGTATFMNSACLHSMNVAGTLSGMNLELQGDSGTNGSIVLSGTIDTEGKTLTLNSTVSGTCQAESGAGTLTKVQ